VIRKPAIDHSSSSKQKRRAGKRRAGEREEQNQKEKGNDKRLRVPLGHLAQSS
jgi:hypothetical protein